MRSAAIDDFLDAVERDIDALHSIIVLRHGHIIAQGWWEPYGPQIPHILYSLSKSFTSTAIGLLVAEGRLSLDAPVLGFFPGDAPAQPSANLRAMRVRHLLSMATGHAEDTTPTLWADPARTWTQAFLAQPVPYAPGTHFLYNTGATYMLAAIVQRLVGMRLLDYLQPRLFESLGIENPTWEVSPQGIDVGGWGLSLTTGDVARFGQLYLQQGRWQERQLIPVAWIEEATANQVANGQSPDSDWEQGYGYQFWRCRHNAYRGDGAFGQFCVVLPDQDVVIAMTAGLGPMQDVLNLIWEHLLPAMQPEALPEDHAAHLALSERLTRLRLPPQAGEARVPRASDVSGKLFRMAENADGIATVRLDFATDSSAITIVNAKGEQRVVVGYDTWLKTTIPGIVPTTRRLPSIRGDDTQKIAASGAWTAAATYTVQLWSYETPFRDTYTFHFAGTTLELRHVRNVDFNPVEPVDLHGSSE